MNKYNLNLISEQNRCLIDLHKELCLKLNLDYNQESNLILSQIENEVLKVKSRVSITYSRCLELINRLPEHEQQQYFEKATYCNPLNY